MSDTPHQVSKCCISLMAISIDLSDFYFMFCDFLYICFACVLLMCATIDPMCVCVVTLVGEDEGTHEERLQLP